MKKIILALALLAAFIATPTPPGVPGLPGAATVHAQDKGAGDTEVKDGEGEDEEDVELKKAPEREELTAEAETVRTALGDYAISMAYLPSRKNVDAITSHLAEDYVKLNDGIAETATETTLIFNDILAQANDGSSVVLTASINDFYGEVRGELAWATYRFHLKAVVGGELYTEEDKSCSAVLEKDGETWLIRLEHCTSVFTEEL